jgi:hypothetical protein
MPKARGFEYWFGGIDLNATPKESTSAENSGSRSADTGEGTSGGHSSREYRNPRTHPKGIYILQAQHATLTLN